MHLTTSRHALPVGMCRSKTPLLKPSFFLVGLLSTTTPLLRFAHDSTRNFGDVNDYEKQNKYGNIPCTSSL